MNQSMINAGVTMNGLQRKLDLIANNLANLNTTGYKRRDASFEDLLTSVKAQRNKTLPGRLTPPVLPIGSGAHLVGLRLDLSQGALKETGNPLDLALQGDAMFEIGVPVVGDDGQVTYQTAWTRNGAFRLAARGDEAGTFMLVAANGNPVLDAGGAPIVVPPGSEVSVDRRGNVYVKAEGQDKPSHLTTLKLVRVARPDLLEARDGNLLAYPAELMDPAVRATLVEEINLNLSGADDTGVAVLSGFLESSNVDLISEMTELINVQRSYQLNARALASSYEMMGIANRLRS